MDVGLENIHRESSPFLSAFRSKPLERHLRGIVPSWTAQLKR